MGNSALDALRASDQRIGQFVLAKLWPLEPSTKRGPACLDRAQVDASGIAVLVTFADGFEVRLPKASFAPRGAGKIVRATVDCERAGLVVRFRNGMTTTVSADFVRSPRAPRRTGDEDAARFGQRIRALRLEKGLSAAGVATKAGMAPSNYSRVEASKHRPAIDTLLRVSKALGCTLQDLVARR